MPLSVPFSHRYNSFWVNSFDFGEMWLARRPLKYLSISDYLFIYSGDIPLILLLLVVFCLLMPDIERGDLFQKTNKIIINIQLFTKSLPKNQ